MQSPEFQWRGHSVASEPEDKTFGAPDTGVGVKVPGKPVLPQD